MIAARQKVVKPLQYKKILVDFTMKLDNLIFLANRKADIGTELYWEDNKGQMQTDEFTVPIYRYDGTLIGYWLFKRACKKSFELYQLLPPNSDSRPIEVSLQGVLYSRQEALKAHQAITAYEQSVSRFG